MSVSSLQHFSLALRTLQNGEDLLYFIKFKGFWQLELQFVVQKLEYLKICFQILFFYMEKANASPLRNISKSKDLEDILTLDILISGRLSKITLGEPFWA